MNSRKRKTTKRAAATATASGSSAPRAIDAPKSQLFRVLYESQTNIASHQNGIRLMEQLYETVSGFIKVAHNFT